MKLVMEVIGLALLLVVLGALIHGPEWIGGAAGKMTVAYRSAVGACAAQP